MVYTPPESEKLHTRLLQICPAIRKQTIVDVGKGNVGRVRSIGLAYRASQEHWNSEDIQEQCQLQSGIDDDSVLSEFNRFANRVRKVRV